MLPVESPGKYDRKCCVWVERWQRQESCNPRGCDTSNMDSLEIDQDCGLPFPCNLDQKPDTAPHSHCSEAEEIPSHIVGDVRLRLVSFNRVSSYLFSRLFFYSLLLQKTLSCLEPLSPSLDGLEESDCCRGTRMLSSDRRKIRSCALKSFSSERKVQ